MYSVLISKIIPGMKLVNNDLKKLVNKSSKAVILPWAFPLELNANKLENEYFKKDSEKYNKYVNSLLNLGISKNNIFIGNCYKDSKELLRRKIKESNILILPGGNPEMFFSKVVQELELLYDIKHYKGIIIGESAGCCLQFKRYFITAKNNYYKYFAWYDGFGIINDPFYVDVHSINNHLYLNKLQKVANDTKKVVYAIYDNGAILLNRNNNNIKLYGKVKVYENNN